MDNSNIQGRVLEVVQNVASELNYIIYESSIYLKGQKSQVIVKIDRLKGISHSDCEIFSKELDKKLEQEDILPNYSIEISSPGLARKVRNIEEFIRFTGAPVKVVFEKDGVRTNITGVIENVIDTIVELKSDSQKVKIKFNDIIRANLSY